MTINFKDMFDRMAAPKSLMDRLMKTPGGRQLVINAFCETHRDTIEQWKFDERVRFYKPSYLNLKIRTSKAINFHGDGKHTNVHWVYSERDRSRRANIAFINKEDGKGKYNVTAAISMCRDGDIYCHKIGINTAIYNLLSGDVIKFKVTNPSIDAFIFGLKCHLMFVETNAAKKLLDVIDSWEFNRNFLD